MGAVEVEKLRISRVKDPTSSGSDSRYRIPALAIASILAQQTTLTALLWSSITKSYCYGQSLARLSIGTGRLLLLTAFDSVNSRDFLTPQGLESRCPCDQQLRRLRGRAVRLLATSKVAKPGYKLHGMQLLESQIPYLSTATSKIKTHKRCGTTSRAT